jgi:hypothetical protein
VNEKLFYGQLKQSILQLQPLCIVRTQVRQLHLLLRTEDTSKPSYETESEREDEKKPEKSKKPTIKKRGQGNNKRVKQDDVRLPAITHLSWARICKGFFCSYGVDRWIPSDKVKYIGHVKRSASRMKLSLKMNKTSSPLSNTLYPPSPRRGWSQPRRLKVAGPSP